MPIAWKTINRIIVRAGAEENGKDERGECWKV